MTINVSHALELLLLEHRIVLGVEQWGNHSLFSVNECTYERSRRSRREGKVAGFTPSEEVGAGAVEDPDPEAAISGSLMQICARAATGGEDSAVQCSGGAKGFPSLAAPFSRSD